jgi:L-alanine-DL-glutamate epimerase-like enolase superfamily enzyme
MALDRRGFAKSLSGIVGGLLAGLPTRASAQAPAAAAAARTTARLAPTKVTRIRLFYPQNYDRNGPQAFPQSNMVVLVDTDAGITGIGQGGSPDTIRNVARSVIGRNAFDSEIIWQAAFMDGFYSPGKERLHALGAIDLALWDIKGKALGAPLYQLFGGKAREHIELYATSGLPQGIVPPAGSGGHDPQGARGADDGRRISRVPGRQRHPAESGRTRPTHAAGPAQGGVFRFTDRTSG